MAGFMLTTRDNPFSPFDQWDEWLRYDEGMHYGTCGYLARIAKTTPTMTEEEEEEEIERAMDDIVAFNPLSLYQKVTKNDYSKGKWHPKKIDLGQETQENRGNTPSES